MDEEVTNPPAISVRRMREDETGAARSLAGLAFSRPENAFFSPPPQTLVAERDGRPVGAVVPKVFALPDRRRCGGIFWLMTDPQARGLGVGGRLWSRQRSGTSRSTAAGRRSPASRATTPPRATSSP